MEEKKTSIVQILNSDKHFSISCIGDSEDQDNVMATNCNGKDLYKMFAWYLLNQPTAIPIFKASIKTAENQLNDEIKE